MKARLQPLLQPVLCRRAPGSRLAGIYYSQKPDLAEDVLPFYLFRKNADAHYPLIYFHPEGKPPAAEFIERFDVQAVPLPPFYFCSKIAYSLFLTSLDFYRCLERHAPQADWYLIFQWDSFLVREGLAEFMGMEWDYYGSPWEKGLVSEAWCEPRCPEKEVLDKSLHSRLKPMRVGNGGFSLRRIKPCRRVCEEYRLDQLSYMQEDAFYCNFGQLTGLRFAPLDAARRFAWEDAPAIKMYVRELGIKKPLGFHNLPAEMAGLILRDALGQNG